MFTDTDGVKSESVMYVYTAMVHTDCKSVLSGEAGEDGGGWRRQNELQGGRGCGAWRVQEASAVARAAGLAFLCAPHLLLPCAPVQFTTSPSTGVDPSFARSSCKVGVAASCLFVCLRMCVHSAETHACRSHHMLWMHRRHQICPHRRTTRSTIFIRMLHSGVSVCVFPCAQVCIRARVHACVRACMCVVRLSACVYLCGARQCVYVCMYMRVCIFVECERDVCACMGIRVTSIILFTMQ